MAIPFILATDIGTDVDDALALAFALRCPKLELRAVTTVSGDTVRRARIAKMLLRLAGRDDVEVAAGGAGEIKRPGRPPAPGPAGRRPATRRRCCSATRRNTTCRVATA